MIEDQNSIEQGAREAEEKALMAELEAEEKASKANKKAAKKVSVKTDTSKVSVLNASGLTMNVAGTTVLDGKSADIDKKEFEAFKRSGFGQSVIATEKLIVN